MKKIYIALLAILMSAPCFAYAAEFKAGQTLDINSSFTDLYTAANNLKISENQKGDLIAAASEFENQKIIDQNLNVVAGKVYLKGQVNKNARVIGAEVAIDGSVLNDLIAVGNTINTSTGTTVGNDLVIVGSEIHLNGKINGNLTIYGDNVYINSQIGKNVKINNSGILKVSEDASITGSLTHSSPNEAQFANSSSIVSGGYKYTKTESTNEGLNKFTTATGLLNILEGLVGLFVFAILILYMFPKQLFQLSENSTAKVGVNLLAGFIAVIIIPIINLLMLFTGIAVMPALTISMLYIAYLMIAYPVSAIILGYIITKLINNKKKKPELNYLTCIYGSIGLTVFYLIPIVGIIIAAILYLLSAGSIIMSVYLKIFNKNAKA